MKTLNKQVGGQHYAYPIQPLEFILENNIPFIEANVIKYVMRHKYKNGREDLEKAIDYIEKLIDHAYPEED